MRIAQRARAAHETAFAAIRADAPIAYWPMDEASGNFTDRSGNAHTLTPSGVSLAQTPPAGQFAKAPHWNGTSASASVALDLSALSALTVGGWLSVDDTTGGIVWEYTTNSNVGNGTNPAGFYLFGENDPPLNWYNNLGPSFPTNLKFKAAPAVGTWHHVMQVFDYSQAASGEVKLYLDGALQTLTDSGTQADHASGTTFANSTFYVGARASASLWGKFYLRHLAMFSGALSASRITAQFQAGRFG